MSELDLGSPATTAAAPAPAAASTGTGLVLAPPAPVQVVEPEQAAGAVPVDLAKQTELQTRAAAFAAELAAMDTRSPEFAKKVESITSMGDKDMRASASVSNRMLDRPAAIVKGAKGGGGGDAQTRVAGTLVELRGTVTELDPNRADLGGVKKVLKWLPGGDKIQRYFAKYETAQSHLNAIIKSLDSGQDELRKDNASIETEKANMWTAMGKLSEYNQLAAALDKAVEDKVAELEAAGKTEEATTLRSDALFAIRQRHQDILTQMAVAVQGYMALDLVRKNNIELIKGVDRAQTTTIAALRTAVIVSQALSRQKLVLDQISALNATTSNLIESTSQQLRVQGTQINQQAASSTIDIQKLQTAFENVFQTMDEIDSFRAQAVDSMAQTVTALEGQIERAKPYLERSRRGDAGPSLPGELGS
ncbi:MAG: toxic anion resistance protein [Pseudonocardiales bacterium]|nr:toxic anion resistance protein [Pseudonocardiales bacterium]